MADEKPIVYEGDENTLWYQEFHPTNYNVPVAVAFIDLRNLIQELGPDSSAARMRRSNLLSAVNRFISTRVRLDGDE